MTIRQSFWKAVDLPENQLPTGGVNWDFVDADIWLENTKQLERMGMEVYGDLWCELIDEYEKYFGKIKKSA